MNTFNPIRDRLVSLANPLQAATKPVLEFLSALMKDNPTLLLAVSVLLTFAMLASIVKLLRSLVLKKVESFFDEHLFKNGGRAMLFGLLLTAAVQSSSVTTSLIVPLAGAGILRLSQILPYTMGTNVGTPVTAMLAALATGKPEAVTVAFAHLRFNVFGILLVWPMPWIRQIPVRLAESLAKLTVRHRLIALLYVVIDIERIGDYTKNIYDLSRQHPKRLHGGSLESPLQEVEAGVTRIFKDTIQAFKTSDEEMARVIMADYKQELSIACDNITNAVVSGKVSDLSSSDAAALALYARYLKRIAAHSRNVISSVVNPFPRLRYEEKPPEQ